MGERNPLVKSHRPGDEFKEKSFDFRVGTEGNLAAFLETAWSTLSLSFCLT